MYIEKIIPNKYKGRCQKCGKEVAVGEGTIVKVHFTWIEKTRATNNPFAVVCTFPEKQLVLLCDDDLQSKKWHNSQILRVSYIGARQ